ncbi:MAG TPA: class I SAM-dependent methyltransferase [Actinomycetota bacterium]|nr:class I SAM-dependent methyltransferase [Actinomycetota bacterium]
MTVAAQPDPAPPAYTFDNDDPAAAERLRLSSTVLDGFTISRLSSVGALTGRRCLELGAGNGSVAGWLADQAGPSGQVVATDINTRHIPADRGYRVVRHDLTRDPLPDGPWDVVHARLVLRHVPGRHEILRGLAGALAPGGALVIEEWDPYRAGLVLAVPEAEAEALFYRFETAVEQLTAARAVDLQWPWQVHGAMAEAGLVEVDTAVHARSWPGGSAGARHYAATIRLLRPRLLEAGLDGEQLDRLSGYLEDPRMVVRGLLTVSTIGRRPTS